MYFLRMRVGCIFQQKMYFFVTTVRISKKNKRGIISMFKGTHNAILLHTEFINVCKMIYNYIGSFDIPKYRFGYLFEMI